MAQANKASDREDEAGGDDLQEGGAREWKTENHEERTKDRGEGTRAATVNKTDKQASGAPEEAPTGAGE